MLSSLLDLREQHGWYFSIFLQEGIFFVYSIKNNTIVGISTEMGDHKLLEEEALELAYTCPMPDVARLIGGKWKLVILQILIFHGTKRFNELRRMLDGITQTMLTNQLRALEADGLVTRKLYAEVPPRVEYTATDKAKDLEEMFHAMHRWWETHDVSD